MTNLGATLRPAAEDSTTTCTIGHTGPPVRPMRSTSPRVPLVARSTGWCVRRYASRSRAWRYAFGWSGWRQQLDTALRSEITESEGSSHSV